MKILAFPSDNSHTQKLNRQKLFIIICTVSFALLLFIFMIPAVRVLSISELKDNSHSLYSRTALKGFSISYTHSVNKGRVHDYYECGKDGTLTVYKTVFVSYGAGIPEPEETQGAVFKLTPDGYEISGLNRRLTSLTMAVGVTADHSVTAGTRTTFLASFFAPTTSVV